MRETLKVADAAAILGCGKQSVYHLVRSGRLPAVRVGRLVLISRRALARFLEGADQGQGQDAR
jgi:excisionase family DNA binding protein